MGWVQLAWLDDTEGMYVPTKVLKRVWPPGFILLGCPLIGDQRGRQMMNTNKRVSTCGCYRNLNLLAQPNCFLPIYLYEFLISFSACNILISTILKLNRSQNIFYSQILWNGSISISSSVLSENRGSLPRQAPRAHNSKLSGSLKNRKFFIFLLSFVSNYSYLSNAYLPSSFKTATYKNLLLVWCTNMHGRHDDMVKPLISMKMT